jgi:hypothetical protein
MNLTGWVVSAGLVLTASGAHAQVQPLHDLVNLPATVVSDFGGPGPYAAMPPDAPVPGYGPSLLPPIEVYTVVRENGFSPLGAPQQRGFVYTISVIDRAGDNGRLVIDARSGRIIRFMPAYRMGDNNYNDDPAVIYAPGPRPPVRAVRGPPRPPLAIPRVASRTPSVPTPKPSPRAVGEPRPAAPVAAAAGPAPAPAPQSAAAQPAPAAAPPAAAPAPVEAKPPVQIQPTQDMPKAQGLD